MALSEQELVESSLLRYAQQQATERGAAWFAAEFERRDLEERRRLDPEPHTFMFRVMTSERSARTSAIEGPVDQEVEERVVAAAPRLELQRPDSLKHAHVPRPPQSQASNRGRWRRKGEPTRNDDAMWMPSPAELARMSPAGRRLYGVDDGASPAGSARRRRSA